MKLREYLDEVGITAAMFSRKAKMTPPTVYNALQGKEINLSNAMKIELATGNKVRCKDLVNEQKLGKRRTCRNNKKEVVLEPVKQADDSKNEKHSEEQTQQNELGLGSL